jgi:hypothetical protein
MFFTNSVCFNFNRLWAIKTNTCFPLVTVLTGNNSFGKSDPSYYRNAPPLVKEEINTYFIKKVELKKINLNLLRSEIYLILAIPL